MNNSKRGKKNRNKGNDYERKLAVFFRDEFGINLVTARSLSGGRSVGVDLLYPDGSIPEWAIEAKTDQSISVQSMLKQARDQSHNKKYCAIKKIERQHLKLNPVYIPCRFFNICSVDCDDYIEMTLEHFGKMWLESGRITHYVSNGVN